MIREVTVDALMFVAPVFCLVFVWAARPTFKTGLFVSVTTLAAVACSNGLILWSRERLENEKELPGLHVRAFVNAGMTDEQAKSASGALVLQSYETNVEVQHLMAVALSFPVVLTGIGLGAMRKTMAARGVSSEAESKKA